MSEINNLTIPRVLSDDIELAEETIGYSEQ